LLHVACVFLYSPCHKCGMVCTYVSVGIVMIINSSGTEHPGSNPAGHQGMGTSRLARILFVTS
jgi:hypothetical protein